MKSYKGFTLIELLVVVAIIAILAAIVVPRVADYIVKAREAKAISEVRSTELAITKMLTDAERKNIAQMFSDTSRQFFRSFGDNFVVAQGVYTDIIYRLLRLGREATFPEYPGPIESHTPALDPNVKKKLSSTYLDIQRDPWDQLYMFFMGPAPKNVRMPMRTYRVDESVPGFTPMDIPNPLRNDDGDIIGYPAPKDLPFYMYSTGADLVSAQLLYETGSYITDDGYSDFLESNAKGGGDDINNWDTAQSWKQFYR